MFTLKVSASLKNTTNVISPTGYEKLQSLGGLGWRGLECTGSSSCRIGRLQLSKMLVKLLAKGSFQ